MNQADLPLPGYLATEAEDHHDQITLFDFLVDPGEETIEKDYMPMVFAFGSGPNISHYLFMIFIGNRQPKPRLYRLGC